MITHHPGEVILANLPFIDGSGIKLRPLLVLIDTGDSDVIVAPITSKSAQARFEVGLQDWRLLGLIHPLVVRVHKVTTVSKGEVIRTLGTLSPRDWAQVQARVRQLWAGI